MMDKKMVVSLLIEVQEDDEVQVVKDHLCEALWDLVCKTDPDIPLGVLSVDGHHLVLKAIPNPEDPDDYEGFRWEEGPLGSKTT